MSGDRKNSDGSLTGRVHRTAQDLQRTIENLSVDGIMDGVAGEAVGSGYRGNATHAAHRQTGSANKRDEERRKFTRAMHAALKRLDDINNRIGELDNEIAQHQRNIGVIDRMIEELQANGELEVNEDGTLKNDEYQRQREAYEKRTGKKLDPNDPEALMIALQEQRRWEQRQLDWKQNERKGLEEEKNQLEDKLDRTAQIVDREERVDRTGEVLKEAKKDTREAAISDFDNQERKDEAREALGLSVTKQASLDGEQDTSETVKRASFKPAGFKPMTGGPELWATSIAKSADPDGAKPPSLAEPFKMAAEGDGQAPEPPNPEPIRIANAPDQPSNLG
ncbi:MAG: hypothetical protein ACMVY4_07140 [Minwuia sp.]|uniref:hypothetical protein n=1 Tax=Minwuia sp. TaxID=2493630 RepID=UPI003A866E08